MDRWELIQASTLLLEREIPEKKAELKAIILGKIIEAVRKLDEEKRIFLFSAKIRNPRLFLSLYSS